MVQGEAQSAAGRFKHALTSWRKVFALAREVGDKRRQLEIVLLQADTRIVLGEWQMAAGLLVEVADLVRDITDPELLSALYRVQAAISLERSALETAELDSDRRRSGHDVRGQNLGGQSTSGPGLRCGPRR